MVCTAASSDKCPLAVVGKSKRPRCFSLSPNGIPPIAYTHQSNAWFDKGVTLWWLNSVFWPWHVEKHGEVCCLLLLDNCSAHRVLKEQYSRFIIILFLPPRVTSWHQPADMGMIASLKVGYRVKMLDILLSLFDAPGGYESASIARARQPRGMKGLDYDGKATLLDAMKILQPLWDGDKKYAYLDSIARC